MKTIKGMMHIRRDLRLRADSIKPSWSREALQAATECQRLVKKNSANFTGHMKKNWERLKMPDGSYIVGNAVCYTKWVEKWGLKQSVYTVRRARGGPRKGNRVKFYADNSPIRIRRDTQGPGGAMMKRTLHQLKPRFDEIFGREMKLRIFGD